MWDYRMGFASFHFFHVFLVWGQKRLLLRSDSLLKLCWSWDITCSLLFFAQAESLSFVAISPASWQLRECGVTDVPVPPEE